jgi:hypothetical protein
MPSVKGGDEPMMTAVSAGLSRLLVALTLVIGSIVAPPAARAADADAEALLKGIYDHYIDKKDGLDFTTEAEEKRIFTPELAKLVADDVAESSKSGDVGRIDFDPFINGQDWEVKKVDLSYEQTAPDAITATARFNNFDTAETVRYQLVKTPEGWRIGDIRWSDNDPSFREMLSAPLE